MPEITFISPGGESQTIQAREGESVMHAAVNAGIDGIVADCGGELTCATCHVFALSHLDQLPPIAAHEAEMLDFTIVPRRPESRLSCQITLTPELDGLTLELPEAQI